MALGTGVEGRMLVSLRILGPRAGFEQKKNYEESNPLSTLRIQVTQGGSPEGGVHLDPGGTDFLVASRDSLEWRGSMSERGRSHSVQLSRCCLG